MFHSCFFRMFYWAVGETRTRNLKFGRLLFYQLNYYCIQIYKNRPDSNRHWLSYQNLSVYRPTFTRDSPLSITHTIRGEGIPIPPHSPCLFVLLVGFEPTTFCVSDRCSKNQLSYSNITLLTKPDIHWIWIIRCSVNEVKIFHQFCHNDSNLKVEH